MVFGPCRIDFGGRPFSRTAYDDQLIKIQEMCQGLVQPVATIQNKCKMGSNRDGVMLEDKDLLWTKAIDLLRMPIKLMSIDYPVVCKP